jgi:hypothetical protein
MAAVQQKLKSLIAMIKGQPPLSNYSWFGV